MASSYGHGLLEKIIKSLEYLRISSGNKASFYSYRLSKLISFGTLVKTLSFKPLEI